VVLKAPAATQKAKTMKLMTVVFSAVLLSAAGSFTTVRAQMASVDHGIDSVEVMKVTATVEKIDLEKRKVSLLLDDGKKKTYKVDKSVQNLDQVRVGDHLSMAYTEELVILVGKSNETPGAGSAGEVAVAPNGAKPGMVMTETTAVSAKILAVNAEKHSVTMEDPDGKKKTVKLGKKAGNLEQLKVGDTVDMVLTDSLVVEIVK
jgi:translation elongation factor P/translation initiation factor 5A